MQERTFGKFLPSLTPSEHRVLLYRRRHCLRRRLRVMRRHRCDVVRQGCEPVGFHSAINSQLINACDSSHRYGTVSEK